MKTIYLKRKDIEYELEVEVDGDGFWFNNVTVVSGPKPEHDLDPEAFEESLTVNEWNTISEKMHDHS